MARFWIKVRVILKHGKICHPNTITIEKPYDPLLSEKFYLEIATKYKVSVKELKKNYILLYQVKGYGKYEGVKVGTESYGSLNLMNGATFLFVHKDVLGLFVKLFVLYFYTDTEDSGEIQEEDTQIDDANLSALSGQLTLPSVDTDDIAGPKHFIYEGREDYDKV
jgi:hypothetical protein